MPNTTESGAAKCPFYAQSGRLVICCEGLDLGETVRTVLAFVTAEARLDWQREYCNTFSYGQCPYCTRVFHKYESD